MLCHGSFDQDPSAKLFPNTIPHSTRSLSIAACRIIITLSLATPSCIFISLSLVRFLQHVVRQPSIYSRITRSSAQSPSALPLGPYRHHRRLSLSALRALQGKESLINGDWMKELDGRFERFVVSGYGLRAVSGVRVYGSLFPFGVQRI